MVPCRFLYLVWPSCWLYRARRKHHYVVPLRDYSAPCWPARTNRARPAHVLPAHNGHGGSRPLELLARAAHANSLQHLCCTCGSRAAAGQYLLAELALAERIPNTFSVGSACGRDRVAGPAGPHGPGGG